MSTQKLKLEINFSGGEPGFVELDEFDDVLFVGRLLDSAVEHFAVFAALQTEQPIQIEERLEVARKYESQTSRLLRHRKDLRRHQSRNLLSRY